MLLRYQRPEALTALLPSATTSSASGVSEPRGFDAGPVLWAAIHV